MTDLKLPQNTTAMKDSGVSWIGEIPSDWRVGFVRNVARLESGHTPSRKVDDYWIPEQCTIPWISLSDVWQLRDGTRKYIAETKEKISEVGIANSGARLLPAGTVILSRTASVGFSGIMAHPMATTQDFANWVCSDLALPEYLLYVFRGMTSEFRFFAQGSTHQTIYMPDIRKLKTPIPPLETQRQIAAYLDRKTAAIDALIEKKRRLVELLEEKRSALINHVVTKGLNPDVPMKDSGVPWIGEIPAHWEIYKLKHTFISTIQGWSPLCESRLKEDHEWGVLKVGCVNGSQFNWKEHKALPAHLEPMHQYQIKHGDLLISRANTRELVGSTALVKQCPSKILVCDKLYRLDINEHLCTKQYFVYLMTSKTMRNQIELSASGASSSMQNISQDSLKNYLTPLPPLKEQNYLESKMETLTKNTDKLLRETYTQLDKLKEYRQALITAAVTGKLDVTRDAVSDDPEEAAHAQLNLL